MSSVPPFLSGPNVAIHRMGLQNGGRVFPGSKVMIPQFAFAVFIEVHVVLFSPKLWHLNERLL